MQIRELLPADIVPGLLTPFVRTQHITKILALRGGQWVEEDDPFLDEWSPEEKRQRERNFLHYLSEGGSIFGAFDEAGHLAGFSVLLGPLIGQSPRYAELKQMHVSAPHRGRGLGKVLFALARDRARERGADRLYISAQSSVETQAFYRGLGCTPLPQAPVADADPIDIPMELAL